MISSNPISDEKANVDALLAADRLIGAIAAHGRCIVAFSGGVDSAVVAAAAFRGLGTNATAVTGRSPSVSDYQLALARRVAGEIGIQHTVVETDEIERAEYVANDHGRCFWCKQTLYRTLDHLRRRAVTTPLLSGTNADDLGDFRPGIDAGKQAGVITPLADLGIDKAMVRQIARLWNLSVSETPASPCLASRIAYGLEVTPERLRMIESAEHWLREAGFSDCRVRFHEGELARIEVIIGELPRLLCEPLWGETVAFMKNLGFRFVTLDLEGLRSGNLNQLVTLMVPSADATEEVTDES
jgi:pyridinium-3,5-biscarboxylic acid mononucleotide sulfurtransferase